MTALLGSNPSAGVSRLNCGFDERSSRYGELRVQILENHRFSYGTETASQFRTQRQHLTATTLINNLKLKVPVRNRYLKYGGIILASCLLGLIAVLLAPSVMMSFMQSADDVTECELVDTPGCSCAMGGTMVALNERFTGIWNLRNSLINLGSTVTGANYCMAQYNCENYGLQLEDGYCKTENVGLSPDETG